MVNLLFRPGIAGKTMHKRGLTSLFKEAVFKVSLLAICLGGFH